MTICFRGGWGILMATTTARGAAPHGDCWQREALPASSHEHLGTEARSHSKCVGWVLHMGFTHDFTHDFGWVLHMGSKIFGFWMGETHEFTWGIKSTTRGQHLLCSKVGGSLMCSMRITFRDQQFVFSS